MRSLRWIRSVSRFDRDKARHEAAEHCRAPIGFVRMFGANAATIVAHGIRPR
jgi:hypothetical protein